LLTSVPNNSTLNLCLDTSPSAPENFRAEQAVEPRVYYPKDVERMCIDPTRRKARLGRIPSASNNHTFLRETPFLPPSQQNDNHPKHQPAALPIGRVSLPLIFWFTGSSGYQFPAVLILL
jgi:hypothetical protein